MIDIATGKVVEKLIETLSTLVTKYFNSKKLTSSITKKLINEVKLNLEIIDCIFPNNKNIPTKIDLDKKRLLVSHLEITELRKITNISIIDLFPEKINKNIINSKTKQFRNRVKNVRYLHELINQLYFRINTYKVTIDVSQRGIDVNYLRTLLLVVHSELKNKLSK